MNGIEKIIETITANAQAKEAEILAEAHQEAEAIAERYVDTVNNRVEQLKLEAEQKAAQAKQRIIANAELEARKSLLQAKQDLIDQAFAQAIANIAAYGEPELVELLAKLAAQAAQSGNEELIFTAQAKSGYGDKVVAAANAKLGGKGKLKLATETREIGLGLVLKEGQMEINCVLERLIWDKREALAMDVAAVLFVE